MTDNFRKRKRRSLLLWVVVPSALAGGAAWGLSVLYAVRTEGNTTKLLERAELAAAEEDWGGASLAYNQYLQRKPDDVAALEAYCRTLLQELQEKPERIVTAMQALRRLIGLQSENLWAVEKLVGLYLAGREFGIAEELAVEWMELDPDSIAAPLAIALAKNQLHENREAADTLGKAISRHPDDPTLYPLLVKILAEDMGQTQEAERWLEQALRIAPESERVQLIAFAFHKSQGNLVTAERHLKRALELAPESVPSLLSAAKYYMDHERLEDSDAMLKTAQRVAPKDVIVLSLRASWAVRDGSPAAMNAAAERLVNAAVAHHPALLIQATELYVRARNADGADACLAKIDQMPMAGERFEAQLRILRGARACLQGEYYAAINLLQNESGQNTTTPWAKSLLAAAYIKSGDLDAAYDIYRDMLVAMPRAVDAKLHLAELAWRRGRIGEIRETIAFLPDVSQGQEAKADLIRLACDLVEAPTQKNSTQKQRDYGPELERLTRVTMRDADFDRWLTRCMVHVGSPALAVRLVLKAETPADIAGPGAELGTLLLAEGYASQALALADEIIQRQPQAVPAHALRILALGDLDQPAEAAAVVDQFDVSDPNRSRLLEALAEAHLRAGRTDAAITALQSAVAATPRSMSALRRLVRLVKDLDEVRTLTARIRSMEGEAGLCWKYDLAEALLRLDPKGDSLTLATDLLAQCRTARPTWLPVQMLYGFACEQSGKLQKAADAYRTALELNPNLRTRPVVFRLISVLVRLGQQREADTLLDVLAAALPNEPDVLRLRTQQHVRQRDFDSALSFAERLLELQPEDPAWVATTASLLLRLGQPDRAEATARTALQNHPYSVPVLWALARALLAQNRVDDADHLIRDAVDHTGHASLHLLLARLFLHTNNTTEAEMEIVNAQDRAPEDAVVWAACADVWRLMDRQDMQIACTRTSIELQDEDAAVSLKLAGLLLAGGTPADMTEAGEIIDRRLQMDPTDAEALILDAQRLLADQPPDYTHAERSAKRALAHNPRSVVGYRILTDIYVKLAEFEQAAEFAQTGLALAPNDATLLLAEAELRCFLGEYRQAIPALHRLLMVRPRLLRGLELLATAYQKNGQVSEAIGLVERLTPTNVRTSGEILVLAHLHEWNGDTQTAKTLFLQAANSDRESGRPLQQFLLFLERQGDFELVLNLGLQRRTAHPNDFTSLAVAAEILGSHCTDSSLRETGLGWLEEIAREDPNRSSEATYRAGLCFYRCGQLDGAKERFLQAMLLAPRFSEPVNALAWMYTEDLDRPTDAATVIDRFLEVGGVADAKLSDTHAVALFRLGELRKAKERLEYCLRRAGQTPTLAAAHYHLGLVLRANGDISNAASNIRMGLALADRLGGLTEQEHLHAQRLISGETRTDH